MNMPSHKNTAQIKEYQASQQRKYAEAKPKNAAPSLTYGNSNTQGECFGEKWPTVRDGAGLRSENGRGV